MRRYWQHTSVWVTENKQEWGKQGLLLLKPDLSRGNAWQVPLFSRVAVSSYLTHEEKLGSHFHDVWRLAHHSSHPITLTADSKAEAGAYREVVKTPRFNQRENLQKKKTRKLNQMMPARQSYSLSTSSHVRRHWTCPLRAFCAQWAGNSICGLCVLPIIMRVLPGAHSLEHGRKWDVLIPFCWVSSTPHQPSRPRFPQMQNHFSQLKLSPRSQFCGQKSSYSTHIVN